MSPRMAGVSLTAMAPGPNGFQGTRPTSSRSAARSASRAASSSGSSTISGISRSLAGDLFQGQGLLETLVNQALMGGMLIDDHHAVFRSGR
jgi:hypothetical protein